MFVWKIGGELVESCEAFRTVKRKQCEKIFDKEESFFALNSLFAWWQTVLKPVKRELLKTQKVSHLDWDVHEVIGTHVEDS